MFIIRYVPRGADCRLKPGTASGPGVIPSAENVIQAWSTVIHSARASRSIELNEGRSSEYLANGSIQGNLFHLESGENRVTAACRLIFSISCQVARAVLT